jgi:O-antigen ligase
MFGIVGMNPFNLIFIAVLAVIALRLVLRSSYFSLREPIYLPLIIIFFLQAIAIIRFQNVVELQNIERLVWLTRYLKPMQFIIIMILIINFIRIKELPYIAGIIILGFATTGSLLLFLWLKYGFAMTMGLHADAQHILWSNPILGHKVNWSTMFTLAFFFTLALVGQKFQRLNFLLNTLGVIALVLMGFMIAISLARVAYFCILIGLFYFFWKRGRGQLVAIMVLLAIVVAFLPNIVRMRAIQNIPTSFDANMIDQFLSGRLHTVWIPAFKAFIENPIFGRGFNGAGIYFLGQSHLMSPHSGYLSTICDMGLIGLAVMVILFVMLWKHTAIIYRDTNDQLIRRLALACKTQIIVLVFSNITSEHSFLQNPVVVAPFFLSIGILFALYRGELEHRTELHTSSQEAPSLQSTELEHLAAN